MSCKKFALTFAITASTAFSTVAEAQLVKEKCQTFVESDAGASSAVRKYLEVTKDAFVQVCEINTVKQYSAASVPFKRGTTCHFFWRKLRTVEARQIDVLSGSPAATHEFKLMTRNQCPLPSASLYALADNIPDDEFEKLISTWTSARSSSQAFSSYFSGVYAPTRASRQFLHFRDLALSKRETIVVRKISIIHDFGIWKQFTVEICDPTDSSRSFVLVISSWFGGYFSIGDFYILMA